MKLHVSEYLSQDSLLALPVSQPSHIWHVPTAKLDAPHRAVRVNRSILRKLRRLQRLHPQCLHTLKKVKISKPTFPSKQLSRLRGTIKTTDVLVRHARFYTVPGTKKSISIELDFYP